MRQVKNGDTVKVHYTGKLGNGMIFDSSVKREPLQFKIGDGQVTIGNTVLKHNSRKMMKRLSLDTTWIYLDTYNGKRQS